MEHHPIRRHFFYSQHRPSKPPSASQHLLPPATPPWLCRSPQSLCCLLLPSATPRCLGSIYSSSCWVPPLPHPRGRRREGPQRPAVCIKAQKHQKWGLEGREEQEEGAANSPNNQRDPISAHTACRSSASHTHTHPMFPGTQAPAAPLGEETQLSCAMLCSYLLTYISLILIKIPAFWIFHRSFASYFPSTEK